MSLGLSCRRSFVILGLVPDNPCWEVLNNRGSDAVCKFHLPAGIMIANHLGSYLLPQPANVKGSWTNIGNGVIACKSMSLNFFDTTLIPRDCVLGKRTTLAQCRGKWHMEEFCEDLTNLDEFEGPLQQPELVEGVITLACDNADLVPLELGFELAASDAQAPSGPQVPHLGRASRSARCKP